MPIDPLKRTFRQFIAEEWYRCFVKSLPFVFSWLWADFVNFIVFTAMFSCPDAGNTCPGNGSMQLWVQLYVALGLTLAGSTLIPVIRSSCEQLVRIDGAHVHYIMARDADTVKSQKTIETLMSAFFGIAIGWAWTAVAATECSLDATMTCPKDLTFLNFIGFGFMTSFYILIAAAVYHGMVSSHRLSKRCNLLLEIQDGNAKRIFKQLDKNVDGHLDENELDGYFVRSGLMEGPFLHAFHDLDHHADGIIDGRVSMDDLMAHFKELMNQVKNGSYHPDKSIALHILDEEQARHAREAAEMGFDVRQGMRSRKEAAAEAQAPAIEMQEMSNDSGLPDNSGGVFSVMEASGSSNSHDAADQAWRHAAGIGGNKGTSKAPKKWVSVEI